MRQGLRAVSSRSEAFRGSGGAVGYGDRVPGRGTITALLAVLLLTACSGDDTPADRSQASRSAPAASFVAPPPVVLPGLPAELVDPYACRGGFLCGGLEVPLDRTRDDGPALTLQVALESDPVAPRGVLLALNGGPGAPGAPLAAELVERFGPEVVAEYRLVTLDQRGTGTTALDCPALQREGGRQLVPSARAVRACADSLGGARAAYGTDDTVADLERLRVVLGGDPLTVFAMSYGTFVAQQYAMAHPEAVRALVLDSALPASGPDPVQRDVVGATRRVLRLACRAQGCPGDPVADLAAAVRAGDGADLLELATLLSAARPSYDSLLAALRSAARGDRRALQRLLAAYRTGFDASPEVFSAGLSVAARCGDQRYPWGRSDAPVRRREPLLRQAVADAGDPYPFDAAALRGSGPSRACLAWPPTVPSEVRLRDPAVPDVPVLVLAGDRDLSTPLETVRSRVLTAAPEARLVVVRGAGHVVTARPGRGRSAVRAFLLR